MSIVLPILLFAAVVGLGSRKITTAHWIAAAFWIVAVITYNYIQHIGSIL